ncbi:ABC transporter substrate-binding protein [Lachnospiraceae bacterium OttesenSCG-928-D06]|nr:ABC transporter substrate-binding protein [Lachnospiraceae bacterium OttesenSCG-928-D06]
MKKRNKFLSVVMAAMLSVSMLTACGDNTTKDNASQDAGNTTENSQEVESNVEATTEGEGSEAAFEGTFKLGGIGPTTGGTAIYGQAVKNAAQLAVDEINAAGGVNGYAFELNFQDDENDTEKSVNAYNTLKDWGAQMLVGCVTSKPCIAVAEKTKDDNMFQITPSGSAVDCVKYDNAFRVCFSDPNQGVAAAQYISDKELGEKVAVIYNSSDVYSSGIYEAFAKEANNHSFEIVAAEAFTDDSNTDFSVQIQKAKDAGADLVFLPIYYAEASLIFTQANTAGYTPAILGCDGMDGILGVENFDVSLAEGVMFLSPFATDANQLSVDFTKAYEDKFGETPNQFAADSYDAIYIIKAAIEACNATPDMDISELCEALKGVMTTLDINGLTGSNMSWTVEGEPDKEPIGVKIENGTYTIM